MRVDCLVSPSDPAVGGLGLCSRLVLNWCGCKRGDGSGGVRQRLRVLRVGGSHRLRHCTRPNRECTPSRSIERNRVDATECSDNRPNVPHEVEPHRRSLVALSSEHAGFLHDRYADTTCRNGSAIASAEDPKTRYRPVRVAFWNLSGKSGTRDWRVAVSPHNMPSAPQDRNRRPQRSQTILNHLFTT